MTNVQMDLGPLACPGPLVAISKAIRVMNPGETLEVNATDPAFCADVRAWCEMTGNQLLALEQGAAGCRAVIRKSPSGKEPPMNADERRSNSESGPERFIGVDRRGSAVSAAREK